MAASRDARIACIPVLLALALLVVGMQPSVANAQVSDRPSDRSGQGPEMNHRQLRGPDASTRLPSWAEPAPNRSSSEIGGSSGEIGANSNATGPLPPEPDPIPVDGGLSLLALAGAGYAARKLRQSSDEEDEVDRDDLV
jgi:hypothetical protein